MEYYDLNESYAFLISQKAILVKKNRILLLKHFNFDAWGLPGGLLEFDENLFDGIKREVKEETNLVIKSIKLCWVSSVNYNKFVFKNKTKKNVRILQIGYKCEFLDKNITLSNEHTEYKWFDLKNINLKIISKDSKKIVEEFIKQYKFDII